MTDNSNVYQGQLGTDRPSDVQISSDGSTIYAAGADGNLYVYSAATGELEHTWAVGTQLGGMDISPDGAFAIVTELVPVGSTLGPNSSDDQYTITAYKVDLTTGVVTSFPTTSTGYAGEFYDAAILSDGTVLLTQSFPGASGYSQAWVLDPSTGQYTQAQVGVTNASVLTESADHSSVLVSDVDVSDAPLYIYGAGQGVVAYHGSYQDGIDGWNRGVQAYNAGANLVVQSSGPNLYVYDSNLHYQFDLAQLHPELTAGGVAGVTFDASGQYLFVLNDQDNSIYEVSTTDWSIVSETPVGADVSTTTGDFGNRLLVAPDSSYFTVVTDNGLVMVDPTAPPVVTATGGDDAFVGTSGGDVFDGLGGNDLIKGLDGSDALHGGAGNDIISGGHGADVIDGGDGNDIIYTDDISPAWTGPDYWHGAPIPPILDHGTDIDTVTGGAGDDTVYAGYGDNVDGGMQGTYGDTLLISFQGASQGVTYDAGQAVQLIGGGTITGFEHIAWVEGSNFNDTIDLTGSGSPDRGSVVYGMGGDDHIIGGDNVADLDGGDGNDFIDAHLSTYVFELNGGAGDDVLIGNGSSSTLTGGTGNDTMTGGGGNDVFVHHLGEGIDTITDFNAGDTLQLNDAPQSITQSGNDVIVYFSNDDQVILQNTDVATVLAGIANDAPNETLIGGDGNDSLTGLGGSDVLVGGDGADTLNGGGQDDMLYSAQNSNGSGSNDTGFEHDVLNGGAGNDALFAGYGDDVDGGAGTDHLSLNLSIAPSGITVDTTSLVSGGPSVLLGGTIQGIEIIDWLQTSEFNDTITIGAQPFDIHLLAGGGDDTITWNAAGGEADGGAGNDTLTVGVGGSVVFFGGDGNDTLFANSTTLGFGGGDGFDTIDFRNMTSGVIASLVNYSSVEGLNGSAFADMLTGDNFANVINGGTGDDTIVGGAGNDTLTGGDGNDTFVFHISDGQDTITDFTAGDILRFIDYGAAQSITQSGADVIVQLSSTDEVTLLNTTVSVVIAGTQFVTDPPMNLVGTPGDDTLIGGSGNDKLSGGAGNDWLDGGLGADTMTGGAGNDTFIVDNPNDVVIEAARGGSDTVLVTTSYVLSSTAEIEFLGIYYDPYAGAALPPPGGGDTRAINLTGNGYAQTITGNAGDNVLSGMGGNDVLNGGYGNDTLSGGAGNDTLTGGAGNDTFLFALHDGKDIITDFSTGDTLQVTGYTAAKSVVQSGTNVIVTLSTTDVITLQNTDIATVNAGLHFSSSTSGGGTGGGASNTPTAGDDTLTGTSGNDTINGLAGNDTISGLAGVDTINGGDGNDIIRGGLGNDILTGGAGADIFVFEPKGGNDKITDFVSGTDKLDLRLLNTDMTAIKEVVNTAGNMVISVDANHDGRADFTITLIHVSHVNASDFIFA